MLFDKDLPLYKAHIGYVIDWFSEDIPKGWVVISDLGNCKLIQKVK